MEKPLKYVLELSLEEIALRKVAILLWSGSDVLASITESENPIYWRQTIEKNVKDKVLKLNLPASLLKQIANIVRPIGLEIKRWKLEHEVYLCRYQGAYLKMTNLPDSTKLCWTTAGTINHRKTAEELMHCNLLDPEQCYKLACRNGLEDYIPHLWEELPEETKNYFYEKKVYSPDLEYCWPHILKKELSGLDNLLRKTGRKYTSFYQYAFQYSAKNGNKTAAEYFFQKLKHKERKVSVMKTFPIILMACLFRNDTGVFNIRGYNSEIRFWDCLNKPHSDVLVYLLSLITPEQRIKIIKSDPINFFVCFLSWPMQNLFLENADLIWTYVPPNKYGDVLWKMWAFFKMTKHYFPELFHDFFSQSPPAAKKGFVKTEIPDFGSPVGDFLSLFFYFKDLESIRVIFRSVDASDKVEMVFQSFVLELFHNNMLKDGWPMVEECLREASLSKADSERLGESFAKLHEPTGLLRCKNQLCVDRFLKLLDESNVNPDVEKKAMK